MLALCAPGVMAEPGGQQVLKNGATVTWRIDPPNAESRLGLSTPAFAQWTPDGFEKPLTIKMRSDALAVVDAWEVAIYRLGDTEFKRPLRQFRGTARTLHTPLYWSGETDEGPALRPGETVVARLSIRDVAGNIDSSVTQKTLVARFMMRAERRKVAVLDAERESLLDTGSVPAQRRIPTRGSLVDLILEDWKEGDAPHASGMPLRQSGGEWGMGQLVPTGDHDIVIESTRPIIGGLRAVPVGVVRVSVPPALPFIAGVKGTGKLERKATDLTAPPGFVVEGVISGEDAISRVMTNREGAEDRLALALIDAARPVPLVKDERKRRSLLMSYEAGTVSWPGAGRAQATLRDPAEPSTQRIVLSLRGLVQPELVLPHTDVTKISVAVQGESDPLMAFRDYFPNSAEGRLLMSSSTLTRLSQSPDAVLRIEYDVPTFAPTVKARKMILDDGSAWDESWSDTEVWSVTSSGVRRKDGGLLEKFLNWLF